MESDDGSDEDYTNEHEEMAEEMEMEIEHRAPRPRGMDLSGDETILTISRDVED